MSHETLASKIEEDVERPLREYSTKNRDMQQMPNIQSNLTGLAKNVEAAQKKVEKSKEKGPKGADKLATAVAAVEEVSQQWDSRAPFVFEQLQAADEGRLNHLRDVLTQYETHEVDQVERGRQAAESCLNVLLNVETADEIKTFAAKVNGNRPVISPGPPRQQQQQQPEETPTVTTPEPAPVPAATPRTATAPSAGATTPAAAPLVPPPRVQSDSASQRSERSEPSMATRTPPAPEPVARHTPLGGLRRLGTVMNRRKSVIGPSPGSYERKPEKKHRSPFSAFKRSDSSRDAQIQLPESPPLSSIDRPATSLTEEESIRNPSVSQDRDASETITTIPAAQPVQITTNGTTSPEEQAGLARGDGTQPRVDSEGYTERPSTIDEVTRAQREAAGYVFYKPAGTTIADGYGEL